MTSVASLPVSSPKQEAVPRMLSIAAAQFIARTVRQDPELVRIRAEHRRRR